MRALVFLHGGALRSPVQRSHQLARRFADRIPVIYAPYRSPVELLLGDWGRRPWPPLARHPNVRFVGAPLTTFLARRSLAAARWHGRSTAKQIRGQLRLLGVSPKEALFFVQSATAAEVLDAFPDSPVFYDCADDMSHWHGASPAMSSLYQELEDRVVRRAHCVAVTIPRLQHRFEGRGPKVIQSSNGVDAAFLLPTPTPSPLTGIPAPRLVFAGILSRFVDAEVITALSDADLGSVVLVGPVDPRSPVARLRGRRNIHWLGRKEHEELPGYLHGSDVGLIPGTTAQASDCVPSKLFMYCAAGLPVVAHDCSSLRPYSDRIRLAAGAPAFVAQARKALERTGEGRELRLELARANSWDRIADELLTQAGVG